MTSKFLNQSLAKSQSPNFWELQNVHDLTQAGAGSARFYPGYYGNGYPIRTGWANSLGEIFTGIIFLAISVVVVYWVIMFFSVMQRKMYYGYRRKKRSVMSEDDDGDAIEALLGVSKVAESWRNGNPNFMRMLKTTSNDHITANMTAQITSAIEEKSMEFEIFNKTRN